MYVLVLAGGSGTRLWPHSRSHHPKQFLGLHGERTMLQETVDRVRPIVKPEQVFVATGAMYADLVAEQLPDVPRQNILSEPSGRGTAPCIGLAALHLRQRDPDAVMAVLSADHQVERADLLRDALTAGERMAHQGYLVTLGIHPTSPSTGYGYIQQGVALSDERGLPVFRVQRFVEKPDAERAQAYFASGNYSWNAGIFVWRADRILAELAQHRPDVAVPLGQIGAALADQSALERVWPQIENVAIDVAVMEPTSHAVVIPVDLGWSDVGDWDALAETMPPDDQGNAVRGKHVSVDTHNTLIFGNGRVIATIGLEDLVIVDTPDVVLICPRSRAQDVKALVAQVRQQYKDLA